MRHTLLQAPIRELYDTIPTCIPSTLAFCKISNAASSFPAWPAASINALRNICMKGHNRITNLHILCAKQFSKQQRNVNSKIK